MTDLENDELEERGLAALIVARDEGSIAPWESFGGALGNLDTSGHSELEAMMF